MGRTKNSLNKHYGIKLRDLCQYLSPETVIPVPRNLALSIQMFNKNIDIQNELTIDPKTTNYPDKIEEKIEFTITN